MSLPSFFVCWIVLYCLYSLFKNQALYSFAFSTGKYKTQLYDENVRDFLPSSPGIGMHVEVKDPNMKIILSKYYASEGRFTFTSHSPGEHLICLHSNSTRWSLWAGGKLVSRLLLCSRGHHHCHRHHDRHHHHHDGDDDNKNIRKQ